MKTEISSAAYAASKAVALRGLVVKRSHLSEVIAALLGYRTFAALTLEEDDSKLDYHLDDAELLVLNVPLGLERCVELSIPVEVASVCADAFKAATSIEVFMGVADLYDGYVREAMEQSLSESEEASAAMAETNAHYPDYPDLEMNEPTSDLWQSRTEWSMSVSGTMTGEYHPDDDRLFSGDEIGVGGKMMFTKAGRAGLIVTGSDASGGGPTGDDWRLTDHNDELDYRFGPQN
ncbi:hypothetical protein [Rhodanobacter umsongensis]